MIFKTLELHHRDLLSEIQKTKEILSSKAFPKELILLKTWIVDELNRLEDSSNIYLEQIGYREELILSELMQETDKIITEFRVINSRWVSALLRFHDNDRFIIKVIDWLHRQHKTTENVPFGLTSAEFAILPTPGNPLLYILPSSSQKNLLHLPLLIHEKSHAIYRHPSHNKEFKRLAEDFQEDLYFRLLPSNQSNSEKSILENAAINRIVAVWAPWQEELFCDIMGLHMAGPAYLYALSHYLKFGRGQRAFHLTEERLQQSKHPVSWIRIKVLVHTARNLNLVTEANKLEQEWAQYATYWNIKEDFYGYYTPDYLHKLFEGLSDMVMEAYPIPFNEHDLNIETFDLNSHNYIQLMNLAWKKFLDNPETYESWEKQIISSILRQEGGGFESKLGVA